MTLWLEGACGIAGDMMVAALLDLGAPQAALDAALASLGVEGLETTVTRGASHGLAGVRFSVAGEHDHHGHTHGGHAHHHPHRHLADIEALIARGALTDRARALALRAFRWVAEAEAKAHGCGVGEVHFHEVGAVDSIADIVGACVLYDALGAPECVVDGLTEGAGTVVCAHGELPVPVPAVLNLAAASGIPLRRAAIPTELVTPTGIALAATFRTRATLPPAFRVARVGVGLGTREIGRPNALRALLLEEASAPDRVWQVVTNLDDVTGEALGRAAEEVLAAGARDVCTLPCFMKKGRPAYQLQALADEARLPEVEAAIFRATPAIGLRKWPLERTCLPRETVTVKLPEGEVRVKRCMGPDGVRVKPEHDDVCALAERSGRPFAALAAEAQAAAQRMIDDGCAGNA